MVDADRSGKKPSLAKAGEEVVEWLLTLGINGFGPFKGAEESAREALKDKDADAAVRTLIRNHCLVAGAQGFVTNLGGFTTMPVTLPANVGASYLVQTHLAASIAAAHGHDLDSERTRSTILLCLLTNAGTEVLKKLGITVGTRMSFASINRIPIALIREINKRVGFMLLAKYGTKRAAITLAKGVPLVGGVVGGGFDAAATRAVGAFAHRTFRLVAARAPDKA